MGFYPCARRNGFEKAGRNRRAKRHCTGGIQLETKSILSKYIGKLGLVGGAPEADQELITTGIIDSLGILKLVNYIEEKFGIAVSDEDLVPENFQTVNDIDNLVERKQAALPKT